MKIADKLKAVVAAVGTVATACTAAFADNILSVQEGYGLLIAAGTAAATVYAVFRVPNKSA